VADRPLHVAVLESLARKVLERREQFKEQMSAGLPHDDYVQQVGRARECKALLELIEQMLETARKGDFDEEDDDIDIDNREAGRRSREPRRQRAR